MKNSLVLCQGSILAVLVAVFTCQAHAAQCFNIKLPPGAEEFWQPASLRFTSTSHGYSGTEPGYNLYHSGKNLSLSGPGCFVLGKILFAMSTYLQNF